MLFREHMERIFRLADIVKVSDEDLNWLFPEPETVEKINILQEFGPALVV